MRRFYLPFLVVICWLFSSAVYAPPKEDPIAKAIQKGVVFLRQYTVANRQLDPNIRLGKTALLGLALLESGVKTDDPLIMNYTQFIRTYALNTTETYDISLCILYLDRLGSRLDEPMIQFLGARLLRGQTSEGAWGYACDRALDPQDQLKLLKTFYKDTKLLTPNARKDPPPSTEVKPRDDLPQEFRPMPPTKKDPKQDPKAEPKVDTPKEEEKGIHPDVSRYMKLQQDQQQKRNPIFAFTGYDHSNTQFATVALWCVRKHSMPVDEALRALDKHYRHVQESDGGWGYGHGGASSATMTCAGLMGLAVGFGVRENQLRTSGNAPDLKRDLAKKDPLKDPVVEKGLKYLGAAITQSRGDPDNPKQFPNGGESLGENLYFLWGIERVGVVYGIDLIEKHDWYAWGSSVLLQIQDPNGAWVRGGFTGSDDAINTAFALLFLNRANAVKDLSRSLKTKADAKEPDASKKTGEGTRPDPVATPPILEDDFSREANQLVQALLTAKGADWDKQLTALRDNKGSVHTEALARAAMRTEGEFLKKIREALAQRLARMTGKTLRTFLKDENRELRRASALAFALKDDKEGIPDLIDTLVDSDGVVVRASRAALKSLTLQDFGPEADATAVDKAKAMQIWKGWWEKNKK